MGIAELQRDRLSLPEPWQCLLGESQLRERVSKLEQDVDRALEQIAPALATIERDDRALQVVDDGTVRGARGGTAARCVQVRSRLLPYLAAERVLGQALDVSIELRGVETLHGAHDVRVHRALALRRQAAIR